MSRQLALVDLAVRTKLLCDSMDSYVLSMGSPVNKRRRCLHPVVRERQSLVNQMQRFVAPSSSARSPISCRWQSAKASARLGGAPHVPALAGASAARNAVTPGATG